MKQKKCSCCGKIVKSKGRATILRLEIRREILGKDYPSIIESENTAEGYYCSLKCLKLDVSEYEL